MINGMINVYKEKGYTSHDVVARMRGIVKQKKIGHTGTLDPNAEGVLPVCLGNGTKLCGMLTDWEKEYVAEFLFGVTTDTQDLWGETLARREIEVSEADVSLAVMGFLGSYAQLPPMYSAKKVNGKKLYELAREGKEVERKPVLVNIKELEILSLSLPEIKIRVVCSKGTYIRTLGHDIGQKLECGAAMKSLCRTRVGSFDIGTAVKLSEIESCMAEKQLSKILTLPDEICKELPALTVTEAGKRLLENGNCLPTSLVQGMEEKTLPAKNSLQYRVYAEDRFYGIYEYEADRKRYAPVKMFL